MVEDNQETMQVADAGAAEMAPGAEATEMAISVTCPVCHVTNPAGEQYCADCGFLLSSEPVEAQLPVEEGLPVGEGFQIPPPPGPLVKLVDPSTGREFALKPGANTIGRQDTDVLLTHPTVSRSHAKLTVADGKYILEDMGSTNGTFAGDSKVEPGQPIEVEPGTEIKFGSVALRLEGPEGVERVEGDEGEEPAEEAAPPAATAEEQPEAAPAETATVAEAEPAPSEAVEEPGLPEEATPEKPVVARLVAKADGQEFQIVQGENTLGRKATNDIVVPDPYASGSHALITEVEGRFTITDVGSTNGTLVNGEKLAPNEPHELAEGDEITVGQSVFRFTV